MSKYIPHKTLDVIIYPCPLISARGAPVIINPSCAGNGIFSVNQNNTTPADALSPVLHQANNRYDIDVR